MNKLIKLCIALAATLAYGLILRHIAPSHEPYFILGLGLIGGVAWLWGTFSGLIFAGLLIPFTSHIYAQFSTSISFETFAYSPPYIAIEILTAFSFDKLRKHSIMLAGKEADLKETNTSLQSKLSDVQELGGIHAICSECKKITDDNGQWIKIDAYLRKKTKIEFSHGICPDCADTYTCQLHQHPES